MTRKENWKKKNQNCHHNRSAVRAGYIWLLSDIVIHRRENSAKRQYSDADYTGNQYGNDGYFQQDYHAGQDFRCYLVE